ncbi:rhodanese-like domain-containing protein [Promicromonospora sp. NPDC023987]|uniref:rhodanese-like domain-containing protein n=1 Tax=Promicromonospora sp. NPDC023987 TaxID=3155360 RepID=UPI0033FE6B78
MAATATVTTIEPDELKQRLVDDALTIIDVRTPAEFESVHIRGSYNVPLPLLSEHTHDLADRLGGRVVLVCHSGVRAGQAQVRLSSVGLPSGEVLAGGITAFESAGGPVVRGAQRWAMDRQVRMVAGSLVLVGFLGSTLIHPRLGYLTGAIGAGLTYSALSNSCVMAAVLSRMPWNRTSASPTYERSIRFIPVTPQAVVAQTA